MAEYIEREALLERIDGIWDCADMVFEPNDKCCRADDCASCKWRETKNAIRKIVANIPAADVRPVVRGTWGHRWCCSNMSGYEYACSCSACGEPTYRMSLLEKMPNFCPNCGARMEES